MPCCTYLNDGEYTKPTGDVELNRLLAEVRDKTGEDWRIAETNWVNRRWFHRTTTMQTYELYCHVSGPEFQIINFYRPDHGDWSINHSNQAAHVAAFLYGVLAGIQAARKWIPA